VRIERNAFNTGWISDEQRQSYLSRLDSFARV